MISEKTASTRGGPRQKGRGGRGAGRGGRGRGSAGHHSLSPKKSSRTRPQGTITKQLVEACVDDPLYVDRTQCEPQVVTTTPIIVKEFVNDTHDEDDEDGEGWYVFYSQVYKYFLSSQTK